MPNTEHIHLPLYTDEETPDISTTGHYNHAMEILDAEAGELESKDSELSAAIAKETADRKAADTSIKADLDAEKAARAAADAAEKKAREDADTATGERIDALDERETTDKAGLEKKIADETAARTKADSDLGKRIDNAETEISANSADLTGIKGLTYGSDHVQFIENENGAYTSPALEEIAEQINGMLANGADKVIVFTWNNATKQYDSDTKYNTLFNNLKDRVWVSVQAISIYGNVIRRYPIGPRDYLSFFTDSLGKSGYRFMTPLTVNEYDKNLGFDASIILWNDNYGSGTANVLPITSSWDSVGNKPFSTIGSGLKVVSDALTVDTSALPTSSYTWFDTTRTDYEQLVTDIKAALPNCGMVYRGTGSSTGDDTYYPLYGYVGKTNDLLATFMNAHGDSYNVSATGITFTRGGYVTRESTWAQIE